MKSFSSVKIYLAFVPMLIGTHASYATSDANAPLISLFSEYSDYVDSIQSGLPISADESQQWVDRFGKAISNSSDNTANQAAWEVIISHLNYHARWTESLAACDAAIDSAVQESVRFSRMYDKYTVLAAIAAAEGPEGLRGDQDSLRLAAEDAISQFDTMMDNEEPAAATVWPSYLSLAWARLNDTSIADPAAQEALGRKVLTYGHALPIRTEVYTNILANVAGLTAGITMIDSPDRAAKLIAEYADRPIINAASLAVALTTADRLGASHAAQNKFLWAIADLINDDDLLGAALRHARAVMIEERQKGEVPLGTGSHKVLAGVPLEDITDMIAPLVDDLIVRSGGRSLPMTASKLDRQRWEHAKSGAWILADLYEIDGEKELAGYYRQLFSRIPVGAPKSVRP